MRFYADYVAMIGVICSLAMAGCSSGGGGSSSSKQFTTNCVPAPAGNIAWTFEDCGPYNIGDTLHFDKTWIGEVPSGSGHASAEVGETPIDKGHLSFKYSDFDWNDMEFPPNDQMIVALFAQDANETMLTSDWHILSIRRSRDGNVITRLASQRFDDICITGNYTGRCKQEHELEDMPLYDRSRVYRFDCSWDSTVPSMLYGQGSDVKDGLVTCKIFDSTDSGNESLISTYQVPTFGPMTKLDTFIVGGRTGQAFNKPNMYNIMTDVRITFFK